MAVDTTKAIKGTAPKLTAKQLEQMKKVVYTQKNTPAKKKGK